VFFAIQFTEFHPDYAVAKLSQAAGEPTDPPESLLRLLDWLPPSIVATGVAAWVAENVPVAVGIGLIVVGVVGSGLVRKPQEAKA
jgi:hypothetical protein